MHLGKVQVSNSELGPWSLRYQSCRMGQGVSGPEWVTDPAKIFPLSRVVIVNVAKASSLLRGANRASVSLVSSKPCVHSGSGLVQLLFFFFLIALKFWLRIILGSIENKDKSDFPCIPKGLHDSPLFRLQTNLELQVFLAGFQALIYWAAVISIQSEKITTPLFSTLQASVFKSPFSLWPPTDGLSDLGSLSSYVIELGVNGLQGFFWLYLCGPSLAIFLSSWWHLVGDADLPTDFSCTFLICLCSPKTCGEFEQLSHLPGIYKTQSATKISPALQWLFLMVFLKK